MSDHEQLPLDVSHVPQHRVEALAGVLAGFRWPGRASFDKLTKKQQEAAYVAASMALEYLAQIEVE